MYENLLQNIVYRINVSRLCTNHKTILKKVFISKESINSFLRKNEYHNK